MVRLGLLFVHLVQTIVSKNHSLNSSDFVLASNELIEFWNEIDIYVFGNSSQARFQTEYFKFWTFKNFTFLTRKDEEKYLEERCVNNI